MLEAIVGRRHYNLDSALLTLERELVYEQRADPEYTSTI